MKAVQCEKFGPPSELVVRDVPVPDMNSGEVLIRVETAAVNFPDLLVIRNQYQFKPPLPFAPGSECVGEIVRVGDEVENLKTGDRVIALCLVGAYQEYTTVEARKCIQLPSSIASSVAACLGVAYGTTIHALRDRANLTAGESLLVTGASGGVGLAAVEIGSAMGARVIAAASSEEKLELCREYGADDGLVYPAGSLQRDEQRQLSGRIKELTDGRGVDVIYDPVGGDYAEPCIRALNWNGRYLVIGFAAGSIPSIPMNLALLKGVSLVGVFWGEFLNREADANRTNFEQLFGWIEQGRINPHIEAEYALTEVPAALERLESRQVRGKIIINVAE